MIRPFLLTRVFNTPLMVGLAKLDAFLLELPALLERSPRIGMFDDGPIDAATEAAEQQRPIGYTISQGVATVPVHGVLVRRAGQIDGTTSSPLQSYERLGNTLQRATRDSRVRAILMDVDSPGGEAGGALDLARDIRSMSGTKPLWAIANDDSFSAAYGLASAAQRVWTTRSGGVGSVGVVALHRDQSQSDMQRGLVYTHVHAGARKIDGTPHQPLSTDAQARIQAEVDRTYAMFTDTVAQHRGMTPEAVRRTEAGLFFGPEGIHAGLADDVGTFAEAHAALVHHVRARSPRRASMSSENPNPAPQPEPTPAPAPQPTPEPAPPPAPAPAPEPPAQNPAAEQSAEVIRLAGAAEANARNREIVSLCKLAGLGLDAVESLQKTNLSGQALNEEVVRLQAEARKQTPITTVRPDQPTAPPPPTATKPFTPAEAWANRYPARAG